MNRPLTVAALAALAMAVAGQASAEPGVDHAHVPGGQRFLTAPTGAPTLFDAGVTAADGRRAGRLLLSSADGSRQSADGGTTWSSLAGTAGTPFRLANTAGDVVAVDTDGAACGGTCFRFARKQLTPGGWAAAGTATVTFAQPVTSARFGRGVVLLGDGKTLLAAVSGGSYAAVVASTDDGVTWTETARPATGAGWSAASLSATADGGLIAALGRNEDLRGEVPANVALYTVRAPAQTGTGWGAPVRVAADSGTAPSVTLLGNGALVLSSGRPDNVLRFSFDGRGAAWTSPTTVYRNHPTTGGDADGWYTPEGATARPLRHLGSSGTVGIAPLAGNRVLVTGDNCAPGWGCPTDAAVGGYQVDSVPALWKSAVEVDTDQWGKADLATMFQRGELAVVNTPLSCYGDASGCRQSLAAYAFDGDPRADSSLVTANRSVTLRLPRAVPVTGLGLHVWLQGAADVRIETSVDGTTWATPPRAARDGFLRPFSAPVTARYVRISDPNPVTDPSAAFLHEIELYTAAVGFEHDYPGQPPRGNGWVTASTLATVVNQATVPSAERISSRFLRIKDDTTTQIGRATWTHAAATSVTAEFRFLGHGTTNRGLLFSLKGRNGTAASTPYGFWLTGAGRLHWANYSQNPPWGTALNPAAVDIGTWHTVKLVATMTQVQVYLDGALVATRPKSQAATTIGAIEIGSTGTATTGDDWLIDDVAYTS
ncbi:LamG-like jellyroll fold domain-containing protein [Actinophytocola glycyrrhizae]|uniref:LamG-like jellyroll fold domain-containing protein n=1 Tax=Actinophytocola glycyrrhizae TaxID=2044873 RepID=A0ABV9SD13_9PSEU